MQHTEKPSTAGIALKYGLITGLISIIYSMILQFTDLITNQALSWLGFAILIGGIIYGMKEFKEQTGGYMSYSEGLGLGSLLCAVSGVLAGAFNYFYTSFVDNSAMKKAMEAQRDAMEQRGMSDAEIDNAMQIASKFSGPGTIFIFTIIGSIIMGFILSLIISAIMKKERTELGM